MWSLPGRAARFESSRPVSKWRLESTLYHRRMLPPRFDSLSLRTRQLATGQRGCCSVICPLLPQLKLLQRVGDSTGNISVQALSVSKRILNSSPAAAQQDTVLKARSVVH